MSKFSRFNPFALLVGQLIISSLLYGVVAAFLFWVSIAFDTPSKAQLVATRVLEVIGLPFKLLTTLFPIGNPELRYLMLAAGCFLGGIPTFLILRWVGFFRLCYRGTVGAVGFGVAAFLDLTKGLEALIGKLAAAERYYKLAAVLSFAWIGVLYLIPSLVGVYLQRNLDGLDVMALLIAGMGVAVIFRRWIESARGWKGDLIRGATIPYCAAFIYLAVCGAISTASPIRSIGESFILILYGMWAALLSFYVVIPMGVLSQILLKRTDRSQHQAPNSARC